MSSISSNVGGIQPTQSVERKTTLEKGVELVKEKTSKGTFVGDNIALTTGVGVVSTVAAGAGVAKLAHNSPLVKQAVSVVFSEGTAGALAVGAAAVLAEDAVKSFKDGKTVKGGVEAAGASVAALGGVQLIASQANVSFKPLSATLNFLGKNSPSIIGGGAIAGGAVAVKSGVDDIKEGKTTKGSLKIAGGAVGVLGGTEIIGRAKDIPIAKEALTGIPRRLLSGKAGLTIVGGSVAATGLAAAGDGVRRMATGKGVKNDIIGTAEVIAGTAAVTGGSSLIGHATGNQRLAQVFTKNVDVLGGVALGATAVALGKHTVDSVKKNGVTLTNTATAGATAITALASTQVLASKFGVPLADKALSKGWQPVVAAGLGVVAYKSGSAAVASMKSGNSGEALGKAAITAVAGASSAVVAGHAFNIPVLKTAGSKVIETAGKIAEPVFEFAVKNPGTTLAVAGAAVGIGYYMHTKNNK